MSRELPPTAGLPLRLSDWLPGASGFDRALATWLGVESVQLECSGTSAMVIALQAMHQLRPDRDEVIVPAWTCPLVALAIHRAGLTIRLCDLAPDHFDMDAQQIASLAGAQTLAIVPTHLGGRLADVDAALHVARACGAYVLEDAAQALGARQFGQSVGLRGDAGFFSLAVGKGLTTFEGGILVTRDATLRRAFAENSRKLARPSARWTLQRALELFGYTLAYRPSLLSWFYGRPLRKALAAGDPVAAVGDDFDIDIPMHPLGRWRQSVGAHALARLAPFMETTRQQAWRRLASLRPLPGLTVFSDARGNEGVWPFLMLLMPSQEKRDAALRDLWTAGLGVSRLFIHALPDYGYLRDIVPSAALPQARDFAARSLTITNSPWLTDEEFDHILATLQRVLRDA